MTTQLLEQDPTVTLVQHPDRPFNPHRSPQSTSAREAVATVTRQMEAYETVRGLRQRARKESDQASFEQTMTTLVSDLCFHYCLAPEVKVSISLSKQKIGRKSRYTPKVMGKTLPTLLKHMSAPEMAFVEMEKGHRLKGKQTTLWAGKRLIAIIKQHGLTWRDFSESDTSTTEVIVLRDSHGEWRKGKMLEYTDTPRTLKYRREMERINAYLAAADITFDTTSCVPRKGPVSPQDRSLRRIFNNGSFTQGGRLYGGFWQEGLKKEERTKGIRIGGERTISLDYSQVCPRILYGMAEAPIPSEDIYTIPKLQGHRDGVKKVLNALLHAKKPLVRAPRDTRPLLSRRMKVAEVVKLIEQAHPALAPYFGTGIGMELMFRESQILVEVLLTLIDHGVVALPVHDAVVVREADEAITRRVMEEVFKKHTGLDITVKAE